MSVSRALQDLLEAIEARAKAPVAGRIDSPWIGGYDPYGEAVERAERAFVNELRDAMELP